MINHREALIYMLAGGYGLLYNYGIKQKGSI